MKAKIRIGDNICKSSCIIDGKNIPFFDIQVHQDNDIHRRPELVVKTFIKKPTDIEFEGIVKIHGVPVSDEIGRIMLAELKARYE